MLCFVMLCNASNNNAFRRSFCICRAIFVMDSDQKANYTLIPLPALLQARGTHFATHTTDAAARGVLLWFNAWGGSTPYMPEKEMQSILVKHCCCRHVAYYYSTYIPLIYSNITRSNKLQPKGRTKWRRFCTYDLCLAHSMYVLLNCHCKFVKNLKIPPN